MCYFCESGFQGRCVELELEYLARMVREASAADREIAEAYAELDDIDRLADEDPFAHEEVYEEIEKDLSRERGRGKKF